MSDRYYRSTVLDVNLEAIEHNFKEISHLHPDKTMIAVIKANGYGLGSTVIAEFLSELGVSFFAVATLDEAIELRMQGIRDKILVLGIINPEDINKAIQHRVAVTAPSLDWVKKAKAYVGDKYDKEVWIHIKVNNGFNRIGTNDVEELKQMITEIKDSEYFKYEGVFAHFSSADIDNNQTEVEYERFLNIVSQLEKPAFIHAQNTGGALRMKAQECTAMRIGLGLYGYYPSDFVKASTTVSLKPSITLKTKVIDEQFLQPGDCVGYGQTYEAQEPTKIAVLPIGYADGFTRQMSGYSVMAGDVMCEVVGRVCMDITMIKVPENVQIGDTVTIISNNSTAENSLDNYSLHRNSITYESLCLLSKRIPRKYHYESKLSVSNDVLN